MGMKFQEWWDSYLASGECKLKKTPWSCNEVGIIKEAMEDAFSHNQSIAAGDTDQPTVKSDINSLLDLVEKVKTE